MAEPLTGEEAGEEPRIVYDLRDQLAATFYELVDDKPWDEAASEDRTESLRIAAGLIPVFGEWLTSLNNVELLIVHSVASGDVVCGCGWSDLDGLHKEHVLTVLAEALGGES